MVREGGNIPVKQDATEALVKVLAESGNGLLHDIERGAIGVAVGALVVEVRLQDLVDGVRVRQGQDLLVLGDVLPVVDEDGLQVVRQVKLDRRPGVECILLGERKRVSVRINYVVWSKSGVQCH